MAQAHAARKRTAKRIEGAEMGKSIADVAKSNSSLALNPTILSGGIKGISQGVKQTTYTSFRKMVHTKFMLQASVRTLQGAKGNIQVFIKGRPDQRVPPHLLLASIVYIEANKDKLFSSTDAEERQDSVEALYSIYAKLFDTGNDPWKERKYHGAAFHLLLLANYKMLNEVAGQPAIKSIETVRPLTFRIGKEYKREVDIILDLGAGKERFVELKSMRSPASGPDPLDKNLFKKWSLRGDAKDGKHLHKEFFTDLVQANSNRQIEMSWRFQSFVSKDKKTRGPKGSAMTWVKNKLCETPANITIGSEDETWLKQLTGKSSAELEKTCKDSANVEVQGTKAVLKDFIDNGLFGDAKEYLEDVLKEVADE